MTAMSETREPGREELVRLAERCEAAKSRWEGAGVTLSADIARALGGEAEHQARGWRVRAVPGVTWMDARRWCALPDWAGSCDDALSLVEQKLPRWGVQLDVPRGDRQRWTAFLTRAAPDEGGVRSRAATPALALCAALLRALSHPGAPDAE